MRPRPTAPSSAPWPAPASRCWRSWPTHRTVGRGNVRAYLCDGVSVFEWFTGTADGDRIELTSAAGGRLTGKFSSGAVTGSVSLPGGPAATFDVPLARDFADLYTLDVSTDGAISSTSARGACLTGQVGPRTADGSYPASVTVTAPGGEATSLTLSLATDLREGRTRWIVGPDLQLKGTDVHPMQTVKGKAIG